MFYNRLGVSIKSKKAISPKTIKNGHGILHRALQQAVAIGYIRNNPSDACVLPRVERKKVKPLDEDEVKAFLEAIKGHRYEILFRVLLFIGMREGEILGLTWDNVDFRNGTILIIQQLQKEKKKKGIFRLVSLKYDRPRRIMPAPLIMQLLKEQKEWKESARKKAGVSWSNPMNLVFTNELGRYHIPQTLVRNYKKIVAEIGRPDARIHDLRHSYATMSLYFGDDVKTVQANLVTQPHRLL